MKQTQARRLQMIVGAVALTALLSGCMPIQPVAPAADADALTAAAPAALPRATTADVPLVAAEFSDGTIAMPAVLPAGPVAFTAAGLPPDTTLDLVRLNEGVTETEFLDALGAMNSVGPAPALALARLVAVTGDGSEVIVDLEPGDWHALVFTDALQALQPFTVEAQGAPATALEPGVQVTYRDFAFEMPDSIPAGPQLWEISNEGGQWHMMLIVQPNEGVTAEQVLEFISQEGPSGPSGPPPFGFALGLEPMSEGMRVWRLLDLPPGEYTLICPLPDVTGDMSSHAAHGMVRTLTVTAP